MLTFQPKTYHITIMYLFVFLIVVIFVIASAFTVYKTMFNETVNKTLDNISEKFNEPDLSERIDTVVDERNKIREDVLAEEERVKNLKENAKRLDESTNDDSVEDVK